MSPYAEVRCPRCNGTDFIPRFAHYDAGHCFRCEGRGTVRVRVLPDGTQDHDHRIANGTSADTGTCVRCGLPAADWPPVVVAKWWGDQYEVFLPAGKLQVPGAARRKAQAAVRMAVLAAVPGARIKWTAA